MPEPDDEVESLYGGSSYYSREKPVNTKQLHKMVEKPEPDDELESLADFKSHSTWQR